MMKRMKASRQNVSFWKKDQSQKLISLEDLAQDLSFEYHRKLFFKNEKLEQALINQGLSTQVDPKHLENGQKWKREIEEGFIPSVSVRFVEENVGYGLFAEEDLLEGAFLGEYVGEVRKNDDHFFISDYLYTYPLCDEIGRNFVIDAIKGTLTRFVNHSFAPNLVAQYAFVDGVYHMILITLKPIVRGEQLMFNYGKKYWYVREAPKAL